MRKRKKESARKTAGAKRKKIYAIIGCIGSGKTTVSSMLGEHYLVQNADRIAGEVLATKQEELIGHYGREIVENGAISKSYLSRILFSEGASGAEEREWIGRLINEDVLLRIMERASADEREISFAEITAPTSEFLGHFDGVIVVSASEEAAIGRTANRSSGWSEQMRRSIYRMQSERVQACLKDCDAVYDIDNQGEEAELEDEIFRLLEKIGGERRKSGR